MIDRNTRHIPKPNGAPAAIETIQCIEGKLVHANQNKPTGNAKKPTMASGSLVSGMGFQFIAAASAASFTYRLLSRML